MRERVWFPVAIVALCVVSAGGCAAATETKEQLRSAVDARQAELNDCYAKALQRNATLEGRMQLWVHVDRKSGQVDKVEVGGRSDVEDAELAQCVGKTLKAIRVESKPPADLKIEYTLDLAPTAGGEAPASGRRDDGERGSPQTAAGASSEPASS